MSIKDIFYSPEKLIEGPKIMFKIPIGDGIPVAETVVTTWFIMLFFVVLFAWGTKKASMIPGKKQAFFELLYELYDWLASSVLGKWNRVFVTYIGTLFTFLALANIISFFPIPSINLVEFFNSGRILIEPAFRNPTSDVNTPVGLALITAFYFLRYGFIVNGIGGYFKGLMEPVPFLLPLNIIGEFSKPLNISMRLFGNMFAGIIIMGLLYKFAPLIIPAPLHLYFDLFSGLIQSFIFTMLTMVYLADSLGDSSPEVLIKN